MHKYTVLSATKCDGVATKYFDSLNSSQWKDLGKCNLLEMGDGWEPLRDFTVKKIEI